MLLDKFFIPLHLLLYVFIYQELLHHFHLQLQLYPTHLVNLPFLWHEQLLMAFHLQTGHLLLLHKLPSFVLLVFHHLHSSLAQLQCDYLFHHHHHHVLIPINLRLHPHLKQHQYLHLLLFTHHHHQICTDIPLPHLLHYPHVLLKKEIYHQEQMY